MVSKIIRQDFGRSGEKIITLNIGEKHNTNRTNLIITSKTFKGGIYDFSTTKVSMISLFEFLRDNDLYLVSKRCINEINKKYVLIEKSVAKNYEFQCYNISGIYGTTNHQLMCNVFK